MKVSELHPVPKGLDDLVARVREAKIDLSPQEMEKGRRLRRDVVEAVTDTASGTSGFPSLLADEDFLGGSFGRRTQAQPFDDIDLFFPIDAAALRMESPSNSPTDEKLMTRSGENALGCRAELHEGLWLHSGQVLDLIAGLACANIPLGVEGCEKNTSGRCIHMTYDGINVDLVFVLMSMVGTIERYHLPSGESWCWKATNPKEDQRQLSKANQDQHGGLLLPTIRALKAWNDTWLGGRLKSVHLEVLASHHIFPKVSIDDVVSGLTFAFKQLPALLDQSCPDPTGLGDPLDVNLHPDDRAWVQGEARKAYDMAVKANAVAQTDLATGAKRWEGILLLIDGEEKPDRGQNPRPPGHNAQFGQPAHHCEGPVRYKQFGVALPRAEDRPVRPADQSGRSGEHA